jgi:simple sugar transport system ATP-binding protein
MDEPTTALTHTEVKYLFDVVNQLRDRGVALLFVSHKLEEALEVSQDVTILRSGIHIVSGPAEDFDRQSLTKHITGRDVKEVRELSTPSESAHPLLSVKNLTLPGAFTGITFDLQPGEILGITGLLGSGRTEIAEALFGVRPARSGTIEVEGKAVKIRSIRDALKARIGYLPEDRLTQGLFMEKSVGENIIASSLDSHRSPLRVLDSKRVDITVAGIFERLKIKAANVGALVRTLSGGNGQRVVLGKLLATQPRVLILNGPTVGVDIGSKEQILDILRVEAGEGMGIVVISDDAPELVSVCNRVIVIRQGMIAEELEGKDVTVVNIQEKTAA